MDVSGVPDTLACKLRSLYKLPMKLMAWRTGPVSSLARKPALYVLRSTLKRKLFGVTSVSPAPFTMVGVWSDRRDTSVSEPPASANTVRRSLMSYSTRSSADWPSDFHQPQGCVALRRPSAARGTSMPAATRKGRVGASTFSCCVNRSSDARRRSP
ncbi:hypothetical protein D3C71_1352390 [compost metagenome]